MRGAAKLFVTAVVAGIVQGNPAEGPFRIPFVDAPPELSADAPAAGLAIGDFRQREPKDGAQPSRAARAVISTDHQNLYVLFVCQAQPGEVRAHLSRRDRISGDDYVGVYLDTRGDGSTAYYFLANPLGVQLDGIVKEGHGSDNSFDASWKARGRLTDTGYTVLITIPFRSIRSGSNTAWRMALTRFSPLSNELATWPWISRAKEGFVPQFAAVAAPSQPRHGPGITLAPYMLGARGASHVDRVGLDARVAFHDRFNLDFTVRPDFSQIESDDPRGTVNRRFEVYFPEKRTFFTDHAQFFQTPEELFFSRRIVQPTAGARLTGSAAGWSTGVMAMDDTADGERAHIAVGRVERNWSARRKVGAIFLRRATADRENTVAAIDGRWKYGENWALTAQAIRSATREGGSARSGSGSYVDVRRAGNNFFLSATYRDRSPDLEDDLGYIPRTGIRQWFASTGYTWRPDSGKLLGYGPSVSLSMTRDWAGRPQDWSAAAPFWFDLPRGTSIGLEHRESFEIYRGHAFRSHARSVYAASEPWSWLELNASIRTGGDVNYQPAGTLEPFLGQGQDRSVGVAVRPGRRLRLDYMAVQSSLRRDRTDVYDNRLRRFRASYQITRAFSLRATVDRNRFDWNAALFDGSAIRPWALDVQAAWQSVGGLVFHTGYSNGIRRMDTARAMDGVFYVKMGYRFGP